MNVLSTEALSYQGKHHPLINLIVEQFTLCNKYYADDDFTALKDALDHITLHVKNTIGFNTTITITDPGRLSRILSSPYRASVTLPSHTAFNPLDVNAMKRYSEGDLSSFVPERLLKGSIDYRSGKVSGFFSEILYSLEFTTIMFDGRLSGEELAGVYVHELGHIWSMSVMMGQSLITSTLCAGIVDFFQRYDDTEKRLQFGKMLNKALKTDIPAEDDMSRYVGVIVNTVEQRFENDTGLKFKANELNERLADQFASHWGVGVSLASAIKKLYANNSFAGKLRLGSQWTGVLGAIGTVYSIPWKVFLKADFIVLPLRYKFMVSGIVATTYIVAVTLATLIAHGLGEMINPHGTHPSPKARINAIRRDHVALLQQKVSDTERKALLADIDAIDAVYTDVKAWDNTLNDFFKTMAGYITGKQRDINAKESIADRTHNRLHELTARLEALK